MKYEFCDFGLSPVLENLQMKPYFLVKLWTKTEPTSKNPGAYGNQSITVTWRSFILHGAPPKNPALMTLRLEGGDPGQWVTGTKVDV